MNLERRTLPRRAIHLPVVLEDRCGVTTDVSATGIRFESDHVLTPGSTIEFAVAFSADPRGNYWIRCAGRVVRVEANGRRVFVAATIDNIAFDETSH